MPDNWDGLDHTVVGRVSSTHCASGEPRLLTTRKASYLCLSLDALEAGQGGLVALLLLPVGFAVDIGVVVLGAVATGVVVGVRAPLGVVSGGTRWLGGVFRVVTQAGLSLDRGSSRVQGAAQDAVRIHVLVTRRRGIDGAGAGRLCDGRAIRPSYGHRVVSHWPRGVASPRLGLVHRTDYLFVLSRFGLSPADSRGHQRQQRVGKRPSAQGPKPKSRPSQRGAGTTDSAASRTEDGFAEPWVQQAATEARWSGNKA